MSKLLDLLGKWIPITLILLLSASLYLYQLGAESLWVDELYSIHDAKRIELTPRLIAGVRPVYYLVLKAWMQLGTSEAWLRGLSVLFGLGSVYLTYRLGRRLVGESVGLISALFLAASPLFLYFAQMVRMYALGTFLGLGGTLALVTALEHPTTTAMAGWAILRLLVTLTAPLNITLLVADFTIILVKYRRQRRVLLAFGGWLLLVVIGYLPSLLNLVFPKLPFLRKAFDLSAKVGLTGDATAKLPDYLEILRKLKHFTVFPFPSTSKISSWFYQVYTLSMAGLLAMALFWKHRQGRLLWIAAWTFLPSLTIMLVSQRLWIDRYLLFVSPYLLILLAAVSVRRLSENCRGLSENCRRQNEKLFAD